MKRKIYNDILKWKQESQGRTALLVEGARRVGKSYIVEEFAKENYQTYILIDFSKVSNEIKELFDNYLDNLDYLFTYISNYYGRKLYERNTLFIFDEIQFCPRARGAIKHLVADGRYDYIETGSLISIKKNVKDILIPSEEEMIKMNPMDFEEFLWALGKHDLADAIREHYLSDEMFSLHDTAMMYYRTYLVVGGMPRVVLDYIETKDYNFVTASQKSLNDSYIADMAKYATPNETTKIMNAYNSIPAQL